MGLETATYIHELDSGNPVGASDPKGQGDDHLKLIKSTLQNTFPNIEGEVTASHTELNALDGATVVAADLNKLDGLAAALGEMCMCEVAFLHFSSGGTILESHNIDSVTNAGSAGGWFVNFSAAMGNTPFVVGNVSGSAAFLQINRASGGISYVETSTAALGSVARDFVLIAVTPKFTLDNP